jgi:hypothetical protein
MLRRTISTAVRQIANLAHSVRDVDDPHAVVSQAPDHAEQALGLILSQRGGWFIERQHLQAAAKSAHDLHELTLSRTEIARSGPCTQVVVEAKFDEHAPSPAREIGAIEEHTMDAAKIAQEQILGDREIGNKCPVPDG